MPEIEVSVVCITYNQGKYIEKMLESLVNQRTSFCYEILIHDDASKDGTQDIIKKYAIEYPEKIKPILQTENQYSKGISPQRAFNYPRVKGKYVAFCEGDDYWCDENKLQLQYDAMEKNISCSICVHEVQCVHENGEDACRIFPPIKIDEGVISSEKYIDLELNKTGWLFQTSSFFVRNSVITRFNSEYENKYPVGDLPLVLYSLQYGDCLYIDKKMSCYRLDSGGYMSQKNRLKMIERCQQMIKGHMDFDKRTGFKYHKSFEYAILQKKVEILLLLKKYKEILSKEYTPVFDNISTNRKMIIYLGTILPELADFIERKKNGWSK